MINKKQVENDDEYDDEDYGDEEEDATKSALNKSSDLTCNHFSGQSVFKKDAEHGLSYEKMVYHIDKNHPRVTAKDSSILYCL